MSTPLLHSFAPEQGGNMRDYNFFAPYQQKQGIQINAKSAGFLTLLLVTAMLGVSAMAFIRTAMLRDQVEDAREELRILSQSEAFQRADKLQIAIDNLGRYDQSASAALARFDQGTKIRAVMLNEISDTMPQNVKMASVQINRTEAQMTFEAPTVQAAAELVNGLKQSGQFANVILNRLEHNTDTDENSTRTYYTAEISAIPKAGETNE